MTDAKAPAAAAAAAGAAPAAAAAGAGADAQQTVLFLSHGAGPCFFMDDDDGFFAVMNSKSALRKWYDGASQYVKTKPTAILVISAHWETDSQLAVYSQEKTKPFYDYYGFPASTYQIQFSPPGSPAVAKEVIRLLKAANLPCVEETKRGLDHGSFIPLAMMYPKADVPVLQLSLLSNLDPAQHYAIGKALAPLRKQGVLIIGSGQATHGKPRPDKPLYAKEFDAWLTQQIIGKTGSARADALSDYLKTAPNAKMAHPRAEHYVPLLVAAGAAGDDAAAKILNAFPIDFFSLSCFAFDAPAAAKDAAAAKDKTAAK